MKVRYKSTGDIRYSSRFNLSAIDEVLVGDASEFIRNLDVYLVKKGYWKDMWKAFKDHDIIIDNFNVEFFEPENREDKLRGYTL